MIKSYSCVTGLWWCVGMASTSSTQPWHSGTRVLGLPRSLFGAVILQCTPPENPPVLLKSLKTLRNKRHSNQNLGLRVRMKTCLHELKLIESSQYLNTWWSWDQKKNSWLFVIALMLGHTVWLRAMWIDTCSFGPAVTVHVHMNQHSVSQLSIWTLVMM